MANLIATLRDDGTALADKAADELERAYAESSRLQRNYKRDCALYRKDRDAISDENNHFRTVLRRLADMNEGNDMRFKINVMARIARIALKYSASTGQEITCPKCGGPTTHDREYPPNPYVCDDCVESGRCEDCPGVNSLMCCDHKSARLCESTDGGVK